MRNEGFERLQFINECTIKIINMDRELMILMKINNQYACSIFDNYRVLMQIFCVLILFLVNKTFTILKFNAKIQIKKNKTKQ